MAAEQTQQQAQFDKMTKTPIPRLVLGLAVPTILSMLITSIYNLADTFFVGQISTSASGAVGVVSSLMAVIQAIGFMLGHGSGSIISRSLGSGDAPVKRDDHSMDELRYFIMTRPRPAERETEKSPLSRDKERRIRRLNRKIER